MGYIDMHIHTKNSDGQYGVRKIVKMLIEEQIDIFSITDHDNIKSCIEMEKILLPRNMIYVPGVEFSSVLNHIKCHILGYGIDYTNNDIMTECDNIKLKKYKRILDIIDFLDSSYGIVITETEKQMLLNKVGAVGRTDLCMLLIMKGYGTKSEIFDKYLSDVPTGLSHRSKAEYIISLINKSGGKAILAHPKEIEEDYNINIEDVIEYFVEVGIDGIEIFNSIHTLSDVRRYIELAKKYNLLTTGGSDYHGELVKPDVYLGRTITNKVKIKANNISFKI